MRGCMDMHSRLSYQREVRAWFCGFHPLLAMVALLLPVVGRDYECTISAQVLEDMCSRLCKAGPAPSLECM